MKNNIITKRQISEEKKALTVTDLLKSKQLKKRLVFHSNGIVKNVTTKLTADDEACPTAFTDGKVITINVNNSMIRGLPLNLLVTAIDGIQAHELGHIKFTGFALQNAFNQSLLEGKWEHVSVSPKTPKEKKAWDEIQTLVKAKKVLTISSLIHEFSNITEDAHIEPRMMENYHGWVTRGLNYLREIHSADVYPVKYYIEFAKEAAEKAKVPLSEFDVTVFANTFLGYAKYGKVIYDTPEEQVYAGKIDELKSIISEACLSNDFEKRLAATIRIILNIWEEAKLAELAHQEKSLDDMLKNNPLAPNSTSGNSVGKQEDGISISISLPSPSPDSSNGESSNVDSNTSSASEDASDNASDSSKTNSGNTDSKEDNNSIEKNGKNSKNTNDSNEESDKGESESDADSNDSKTMSKESNGSSKDGSSKDGSSNDGNSEDEKTKEKSKGKTSEKAADNADTEQNSDNSEKNGENSDKNSEANKNQIHNPNSPLLTSSRNHSSNGENSVNRVTSEEGGRIQYNSKGEFKASSDEESWEDIECDGGEYAEYAAADIEDLLSEIAEEKAAEKVERERFANMQEFLENLDYSQVGQCHKGCHYKIHRIPNVPDSLIEAHDQIESEYLPIARVLSKKFDKIFESKKKKGYQRNLYMGQKLDSRSYYKDNGRIFKKKNVLDKRTVAVAILIDESGSMSCNHRTTTARLTSLILHEALEKANIPHMIVGHDEGSNVNLYSYVEFDSTDGMDKYRLMNISSRSCNRDGAALMYVCQRLEKRPELSKIVIVISDGQPSYRDCCGAEAIKDLRTIKSFYSKRGIHIFAAAIGEDKEQIQECYKDGFLDVSNPNRLPEVMFNVVKKYVQ